MGYYPRRGLWTIEETELAVSMREAKATWDEMERAIRRSRNTISMKLLAIRRGQDMAPAVAKVERANRMEALFLKGVEIPELAKIYGLKPFKVAEILARRGLDEETRAEETS